MPSANWNNPTLSTAYTSFLSELKNRDDDTAVMFDSGTATNVPVDAIKFNKASGVFQKWTGAAWSTVTLATAAIANSAITTALIADANVTAVKLASGVAVSNIGYTPANKAGDTFTGGVLINMASPNLEFTETDNSNKRWGINTNGGVFNLYEDTSATSRISIAAGASLLSLGASGSITYNSQTVWHAGNDGPGSTLDADTVDGQHLGTGATARFAALGLNGANDGTDILNVNATGMLSNSTRQGIEVSFSNTTQTLTANRYHQGIYVGAQNNHFDASAFTMEVTGGQFVATSGGTGVSAKANAIIGVYGIAQNATNQATNNTVTNAFGVVSRVVSTNANALITNGYGVHVTIDTPGATTMTTGYLAYMSYTGTVPTDRRGIRLVNENFSHFDGSLGLGIQPTQKLHVSGNALVTGTVTGGGQHFGPGTQAATAPDFSFTSDPNTGMRSNGTADNLAFVTGGADRVTIDATGLVGINVAPGTYRLNVSGSLNATSYNEGGTAFSSIYARLGVSNSFTTGDQTITVSGIGPASRLQSTDATDQDWQALLLDRQSASPAAADYLASIQWYGRNTGAASRPYAAIVGQIVDPTAASEDGRLGVWTYVGGSTGLRAYVEAGLVVGAPTGADKGVGTINATNLFFNGVSIASKQTLIFPALTFYPRITNGAGLVSTETTTNKVVVKGWAFDPVTAEYIQTMFTMPKSWNKGTVDLTIRGVRRTGSGTSAAVFRASAAILDSGDALDIAFGTPVNVTITPNTTNDICWEGTMAGITPSGSTTNARSTIVLQIQRDPANASDTDATNDWVVLEAFLVYTQTAPTED